jgi:RNA polymerase sigma-70 factor (ECF subfamily)
MNAARGDDEIYALLSKGRHTEAFERLLEAYQGKVFRLALAMLGDRGRAEETAQEALIRVWKGLPGFRAESSLSTWIYSIARNACLTARHPRLPLTVSLDEPDVRRAVDAIPSGASASTATDWNALLRRLPEAHREVLALYYMEGKSYQEVAAMLDLPLGTVKTRLYRARKQLAEEALAAIRGAC